MRKSPKRYRSVQIDWARENRKMPTKAESLMWSYLRGTHADGLRFRRQQPIGAYIVDFYCAEAKLVIEIDGESHQYGLSTDAERTRFLVSEGFEIVRFLNSEVLDNARGCWIAILLAAYKRVPRLVDKINDLPSW